MWLWGGNVLLNRCLFWYLSQWSESKVRNGENQIHPWLRAGDMESRIEIFTWVFLTVNMRKQMASPGSLDWIISFKKWVGDRGKCLEESWSLTEVVVHSSLRREQSSSGKGRKPDCKLPLATVGLGHTRSEDPGRQSWSCFRQPTWPCSFTLSVTHSPVP